ncbi:hypothetical protein T12_3299, partial [Trichinella patagoniensis]
LKKRCRRGRSSPAKRVVVVFHYTLNDPNAADCAEALSDDVGHSSNQRYLPCQE